MNISYDYYRIFYYIAKYGSISQASHLLLNSQPNLTRAIRNLESQLGCVLFSRSSRGMRLTPEGERLYRHVRIAFEHIEAAQAELTQSTSLQSGTVYIAANESALRCELLPILKQFRLRYSGVHIHISSHSTQQAITALRDGTADLAVVTTPTVRSSQLVETYLRSYRSVAVCPPEFTALTGRPVTPAELLQYPVIALGPDTKSFEFYSEFFGRFGLAFQPVIEPFTADEILPMVEANLGVGFVPEEFIKPGNNVRIVDLTEEIPERHIVLIKRRGRPLSVAARALERMILQAAKAR